MTRRPHRPSPVALALLTLAAALAALTPPGAARAQGDPGFAPDASAATGFGAQGQLVLSMGATAPEPFAFHKNGGAWQLQLAPAADYFIVAHVSVGGVIAYSHASGGGGTNGAGTDTFGVTARAGYSFAINDRISVWPLGGLALDVSSSDHDTQTNTRLSLFGPLLFHPAAHVFVGAGPSVQIHLTGNDGTGWGLESLLGGWF